MPAPLFSPATPLVLASCGTPEAITPRLTPLVAALATRLARPWITLNQPPTAALAALRALAADGGPGAGPLALLPLDPGQWIPGQGTWAEALGAWRQPVLVVVPADGHRSGLAASAVALLRQERVPLVGLLQLGGDWLPEERRRDGLPWLGAWSDQAAGPPGDQQQELGSELEEATLIRLARILQGLGAGQ